MTPKEAYEARSALDRSTEKFVIEDLLDRFATAAERIADTLEARDLIAIHAMQGMLAHSTRYKPHDPSMPWHDAIAQEAFEIADAMLKARA